MITREHKKIMLDIVKSKPKKRIRDKIKNFFDNKTEVTIFSFSLLLIGIFLYIMGEIAEGDLKDQRKFVGTLFMVVSFFAFPSDGDKKDKFINEFTKSSSALGFFVLTIIYFSQFEFQNIMFDLFFSIILLPNLFYLIKRTFLIFKSLCKMIQTFTNMLFNTKDEKNGFLKFLKIVTAYLVSISTVLATVYTIVNTFKSLLE